MKQIVVAEVLQQGADARRTSSSSRGPQRQPSWSPGWSFAVRKESDGSLERKTVSVKNGQDLAVVTRQLGLRGLAGQRAQHRARSPSS